MRKSEKELIIAYITAEDFRIDQQIQEFQARCRFRHISSVDLVEGLELLYRREYFDEFAGNILRLLHLDRSDIS